jgi:uncharacterized membrane protein
LWAALTGKLSDAEQARSALKWIGGALVALAVTGIAIGCLLFRQLWLFVPTLLLGFTGLELYRGEIRRSGLRAIILMFGLFLLWAGFIFISAWSSENKYSAFRLPASLAMVLISAVLTVSLRARQAARIIEPPSSAPWWLP